MWIGEFCRAINLGDSESPVKASNHVTPLALDNPKTGLLELNIMDELIEEEEKEDKSKEDLFADLNQSVS